MSLRFYDKRSDRFSKPMTDVQSSIVKRYFASAEAMSDDETTFALDFFDFCQKKDYLVACDCEPDAVVSPLLHTARPSSLKRMPETNNTPHSVDCCFSDRVSRRTNDVAPNRVKTEENALFSVFSPFSEGTRNERGGGHRNAAPPKRYRSLAAILFTLLDKAKVNWIFSEDDREAREHASQLYRVSATMLVAGDPENRTEAIEMKRVLVTATDEAETVPRIIRLKKSIKAWENWPAGSRPQGFLCAVVDGFDFNDGLDCFNLRLPGWAGPEYVEARPYIFSESEPSDRRSPYIAIVGYSLPTRQADTTYGLRCYMQPCFSETSWFPIDSDAERKTLLVIMKLRDELAADCKIHIHKPLFDTEVEMSGEIVKCRPDFILVVVFGGVKFRVAVETMGFATDEYEAGKRRTHPAMRKRWGYLIQHDMSRRSGEEVRQQQFIRDLTNCIRFRTQPRYPTLG